MKNNLKYYSDILLDKPNVFHGFFTRLGGVSNELYEGLNCGIGSNDDAVKVQENRGMVADEVGVLEGDLLSLYQVHGAKVLYVEKSWFARPQADGFVTDKAGVALGILTADCAPVLFIGEKEGGAPVIGAAHAGWQGALKGVLENTVQAMEAIGAFKGTINACVGPCISKSSYEVNEEFAEAFMEENEQSELFFALGAKSGHLMFDISGYCAWRLSRMGLKNISLHDVDTYRNEREFYSFRRATHRSEIGGEIDYGRQISVISIKSK